MTKRGAHRRPTMKPPTPAEFFPPAEAADARGLVAIGGKLSPEWLVYAYRRGIFPWPVDEQLLVWWSPDPRAVLELDRLLISRRLERTLRSGRFEVTCDRAFDAVMHGCATAQRRRRGTWITAAMRDAYERLHELGIAHSVEVWHEGKLAGGVYGVAQGAIFSAESMFYYVRDASKVALVALVRHLAARGYTLLDIQQLTPHMQRLGATEIRRRVFLHRVAAAVRENVAFGEQLESGVLSGATSNSD